MSYFVYPYRRGSESAKALAEALGGRQIKLTGSTFQKTNQRMVINWGSQTCPAQYHPLNPSHLTSRARNKLETFRGLSTPLEGLTLPRVPPWTESRQEASQWLSEASVVCRMSLTGQQGSGIIVVQKGQTELPEAPLYTKYIKKDAEYRVHVFKESLTSPNYEAVHVQRKVRVPGTEPKDWQIRSHGNGFKFVQRTPEGVLYKEACPEDVKTQAVLALARTGLDFGAVDVVFNSRAGQAYVLEINCAPGLENSSILVYRDAIKRYYNDV